MIAFIRGKVADCHPTHVIVEASGVGYWINISLNTYSKIRELKEVQILTHQIIREDGHFLYGFSEDDERQLFIHLLSVNGVGANTARVILSSLEPQSIREAIQFGDDQVFRKVKGVGPKTAQRIIIDLKDKVGKESVGLIPGAKVNIDGIGRTEATSALVALGFNRAQVEQVMRTFNPQELKEQNLEDLIKNCLKKLS
ncbi:MAG: Holliday junction branch migration protein RuvA [Saprospiraceae bacterium]|nr:Holliday junction branch migration protein RuvA [Saprospiraceae bacterium]